MLVSAVGIECLKPTFNKPEMPEARDAKRKEMIRLYGDDADLISGLETTMQCEFDEACADGDAYLWPVIPINISIYTKPSSNG